MAITSDPATAVPSAAVTRHLPCVPFRWEQGRFSWVADSAPAILGLTARDIVANPDVLLGRMQPDDAARTLNNALLAGQSIEINVTVGAMAEGEARSFILSAAPMAEPGQPPALAGFLFSSATQAAAQDALSVSERRFRKAFQASPGLFAISDPVTGEHVDVNDCWLETMGWRRSEVIGRTAHDLGVWADPADRAAIVRELTEKGSVRNFFSRFKTRTGEIREFLIAGEVIEMEGLARLLLVAHDMTERNQALKELALLNARLEARVHERTSELTAEIIRREKVESRLMAITDGVADAVVASDIEGNIRLWNRAAQAMFGWTADEAMGMPVTALMPDVYADRHAEFMSRYVATQESAILGVGRELPARRRDGSTFACELSLNHLRHLGENLFIAVIRDITDRKRAEAALLAAKEEAEVANQAKTAFLSSISHELRTPMNAILGFAQILEMAGQDPLSARQKAYVDHIMTAGGHLLALINDVLDLSQIEDGRVSLSLEPVAASDALDSVLTVLQPLADRFGIDLHPVQVSGSAQVWSDRTRLNQILINLGSNAVKYNRKGGSVTLSAAPSPTGEGWLRFTVADTGPGIPVDRMNQLFQPFNRLGAEGGTTEGTGIGLTIARQLTDMMGGAIGVENRPGDGATFWIDLPAAIEAAVPFRGFGVIEDPASIRDILSEEPVTLLCIEDNPANLRLIAGVMSGYPKCRLVTASSGPTGLSQVTRQKPDVVVTDLHLPGMDGFEVLHRLRAEPATATVPIIALSARASPREIERGLRAGFDAYLTKPLDIDRFLATINHALQRQREGGIAPALAEPMDR